jgi:hypothetical protein
MIQIVGAHRLSLSFELKEMVLHFDGNSQSSELSAMQALELISVVSGPKTPVAAQKRLHQEVPRARRGSGGRIALQGLEP